MDSIPLWGQSQTRISWLANACLAGIRRESNWFRIPDGPISPGKKSDNRRSVSCFECARTRCGPNWWPRIKANSVFLSALVTQVVSTNLLPPNEPPLVAILRYCRSMLTAAKCATLCYFPHALSKICYRLLKSRSSDNDAPESCGGGWRSFCPSRLQFFPTHEQRQFSRLTQPGSVLGHFHEKGRVARLGQNIPCDPCAFRKGAWTSREIFWECRTRTRPV